jgi:hypothetical protein
MIVVITYVSWDFLYLLEPDSLFSGIHVAPSYAVMLFTLCVAIYKDLYFYVRA